MTLMTDLDAAGCEDPVPLLPEHDTGPGPGLTQLGHRAVQPQCGANLDLETVSNNDDGGDKERDIYLYLAFNNVKPKDWYFVLD